MKKDKHKEDKPAYSKFSGIIRTALLSCLEKHVCAGRPFYFEPEHTKMQKFRECAPSFRLQLLFTSPRCEAVTIDCGVDLPRDGLAPSWQNAFTGAPNAICGFRLVTPWRDEIPKDSWADFHRGSFDNPADPVNPV